MAVFVEFSSILLQRY